MSDHERGAYTPPTADAPLSFDPRQPQRGARPIPFTLILSVLVLAGLVAAIFMFYQSGVRRAGEAPQTVGAPVASIKAPPPADAQPQDAAAGLQIYRSENGGPVETVPAPPKFAPPPEQPQARPTTPVAVAPAPPVATTPQPAPQAAQALRPALPSAPPPAPKTAAAEPAPKPVPALKVAAATPPPKAVELKKAPPAEAKAPAKPAAKAETKPAEAKPAPKAADAKPAGTGGAAVQIGAVSSTALADKAWSDAVAAAPGLAAGKGKSIEKIEKNGGTLYRTAVTGFASRADAQAFCAKLTAAGKSCFVR
ncbi:MAG: SPOR domain-containing protein [Caulobacterales bacterium]|nr:SPOR domain-containing protein [Caulobacterales bacterium]